VDLLVIHDNSHSILGIRVGDSFQTAIPKLQMHGLVPIRELGKFTYHKEDLVIYFNVDDHHKISEINLTVRETTDLLPIPQQRIY
jgi:membrane protease subunit (stomatin/prohibitin family)